MKPSELLSKPGAWCQGSSRKDADGELCDESDAVSHCLVGAVWACYGGNDQTDALDRVGSAIRSDRISAWNDAPGRTQAEVVALLKSVGL